MTSKTKVLSLKRRMDKGDSKRGGDIEELLKVIPIVPMTREEKLQAIKKYGCVPILGGLSKVA